MRIKVFLFIIIQIPAFVFSQVQWQNNGIPLRIAQNLDFGQAIDFADGSLFITWSETRNESRGIYANRMDNNGNLLWEEEGLEIVNADNNQRNVNAIATDDNCIILTWFDRRNPDDLELRIQKIDSNGNFLWGDEGIILCANLYMNSNVDLVPDPTNGVFVFWYIMYPGGGTYANHILADGSFAPGWTSSGNLIFGNSVYDAVPDNAGNIVFTTVIDDELVIQKMDENCNFLWGATGQLISNYDTYNFVGYLIANSDDTYYVVWRDRRVSDGIYCNLIDSNGSKMWNEDTELVTGNYYYRYSIGTTDDELIVSWIEENNPSQVIAQKIDAAGIKQWGTTGVVASGDEDSYIRGLLPDNNGGCWLSWMGAGNVDKAYVQHLDSTGNKLLEENGLAVCTNDGYQFYPSINAAPDNEIYISWIDRRNSRLGIYNQIVDNSGNLILNSEGVKIIDGISDDILDLEVIANSNGIYYFWKDNRPVIHNEIYLQSIDSEGNLLLAENGISITSEAFGYVRSYDYLFNVFTNLVYIIWEDSENSQIYAQALDPDGNLVWLETGIILNSPYLINSNPKISQKNDYIYAGWSVTEIYYNDNHVIAQKIDQNGNLLWGTEGIVLTGSLGNNIFDTLAGSCYFWLSYDNPRYSLYAKLLDENGNTASGWNDEGLLISELTGQAWFNEINELAFDTAAGYLIYWIDGNVLKGQLISEEGSILWLQGGLPIIDSGHGLSNIVAAFDNEQDVTYFTWVEISPPYNCLIYAQKVDIDGNELWTDNGISIAEGLHPDIARIGDYILIVWEYKTDDHKYDIKAQLLNLAGEVQWEEGGITICDAPHDQLEPKVEAIDDNNFVICWRDNRAGQYGENEVLCTSIYTQKVYAGPTYSPDDILNAITAKLHQNYPNPFNPSTTISFSLTTELTGLRNATPRQAENTEIVIYNLRGQKIKTLDCSNSFAANARDSRSWKNARDSRSTYTVIWNGDDDNGKPVSSGVYFYKLKAGDFEETRKCLLMK